MKTNIQKRTLGGAFFMSFAVLLFIVSEQIASYRWTEPAYSFASNLISDLGVPVITQVTGHTVNSPFHALINFTFVTYGILVALAYSVISPSLPKENLSNILAISHGLGFSFVGVFPGYDWSLGFLHSFGAIFVILGIIGLVATVIMFVNTSSYYSGVYERFAIYPTLIWNLIFGMHILLGKKTV